MAETTIVFPDLSRLDEIDRLLPGLDLPGTAEYRTEPALDYPGQQVAIDLFAATDDELAATVSTVRHALLQQFRVATRTSGEIDQEVLLNRGA